MAHPRPFDAWSVHEGAEALLLVTAAIESGLLRLLERERTDRELAAESGLHPRAVSICLGALEELGVVERGRRGFRLTAFGRSRFVDPRSPAYIGAELPLWRSSLRGWLFLDEVLRSGKPLPVESSEAYREKLYRSVDAKSSERISRVVNRTLARSPVPRPHVLDVGGGAGTYARAFLARGCRVTLIDRPETIEHVRSAFGLDRFRDLALVAGDFTRALPEGAFQVVLLSDVIHDLSPREAQRLLERVAAVSSPAGVIAVADLFRGRSPRAALFAVTLLLYTEAGDTYPEGTVIQWLARAGFGDPIVEDLDAGQALLTACLATRPTARDQDLPESRLSSV